VALQIKIQGETPKSGKSLCHTCKYSSIVVGQNCEELIVCQHVFEGRVTFKVARCGEYHPSNMPWKHEMEDMAWKIEARKRGQKGFQPDGPDLQVVVTPPKNNGGFPE